MWDRHPVLLSLVHMLPEVADRHGFALAPLLARAGLAENETFTGGVAARAQVSTLLLSLAQRTGQQTIGLDLAAMADPKRLGLVGTAFFAGRTLRECLAGLVWQMSSLQSGVSIRLQERDGMALWCHRLSDSDPGHARVLNEGIASFVARAVIAVSSMDPDALSISLPHRAFAPVRAYEETLNARFRFGATDEIVLQFDTAWLDQPNRLGSPVFGKDPAAAPGPLSMTMPEALWRDDDAMMGAILRIFESSALSGSIGLTDTARSLGFAPRSLQRRLAGLGTSFEAEMDRWRNRQARHYLMQGAMPIAAIARALGYGHPAHFVRAFRRWEGQTPVAFRRAVAAQRATRTG